MCISKKRGIGISVLAGSLLWLSVTSRRAPGFIRFWSFCFAKFAVCKYFVIDFNGPWWGIGEVPLHPVLLLEATVHWRQWHLGLERAQVTETRQGDETLSRKCMGRTASTRIIAQLVQLENKIQTHLPECFCHTLTRKLQFEVVSSKSEA